MADTPAPLPSWADLDANLLSCVLDRCTIKDYAYCRAVCRSWRTALPPPLAQPLAVLPADGAAGHAVSLAACLLHTRRWHRLPGLHQPTKLGAADCRCVGARDGWLALVAAGDAPTGGSAAAELFNPFTGEEIALDASTLYEPGHDPAPKIAFSPNPTRHHFVAASACRPKRLALQRAYGPGGGSFCAVEDTDGFMDGAVLVDVACGRDDAVYCLARGGQVYVVRFQRRRRGCGSRSLSAVEVRPLLSVRLGADAISRLTDAKNLVLCDDGALYQVWRRPTGAGSATVDAPPDPPVHVHEGDVFVLRYNPRSWPRWTVAEEKDLVDRAVFVGMNDAVVVRSGDGVRANSVYYWDRASGGGYCPVVYGLATGSSVRWPAATRGLSSPVWYFMPVGWNRRVEAPGMEYTIANWDATCSEYDDEDDDPADMYDTFCSKKNRKYAS